MMLNNQFLISIIVKYQQFYQTCLSNFNIQTYRYRCNQQIIKSNENR